MTISPQFIEGQPLYKSIENYLLPSLDDVGQILSDAAELIRVHGHAKDKPGNKTFGFCAIGAIIEAARSSFGSGNSHRAILKLANYLGNQSQHGIAKWNDAPERTKAEVIIALEGAAFYK